MPQTLLDEVQIEVRAPVEDAAPDMLARLGLDILVAHIRRIADDGGKRLALRQFKEVHHPRPGGCVACVDLDAQRKRKMLQEGAVTTGRLKHPPAVTNQGQHRVDDQRRRKHLPESTDVAIGSSYLAQCHGRAAVRLR
jgi:hypothetical protein